MEFVTKKTTELTTDELCQLSTLFYEVFERQLLAEDFKDFYVHNFMGYSYHTLILNEGKIVGANSLVPIKYVFDDIVYKFVNSGGTMISKTCRGIENFYDMIKESYRNAEAEGFIACTGFPNDNSYPLFKGTKLMRDIGKMNTYILPYRIGCVKKKLAILNPLSKFLCSLYVTFNGWIASNNLVSFKIHKDHHTFDMFRYQMNGGDYNKIKVGNGYAYYRIAMHEGVRTAFIVDVTEKSARNFQKTVKGILKTESQHMDLILYVGNLPFKNNGLIKLPRKYEPKNFNFTGQILCKDAIDKKIFFDYNNWDVNLSNYDLI